MHLLSAQNVRKVYRTGPIEVEALRGVDLDIAAGEFVTVMGPSGNGKTTLLNCLSGLDEIDDGTVTISGNEIHSMRDRKRTSHRAEHMGFVFQAYNLIPVLSAAENVELPLLLNGATPKNARREAITMLERVGLGARIANRPNELSGGEQQRVTIARALVARPAIIWADEPTGNLDQETAADILDLLGEVHAAGQAIVMVTHDAAIGQMGDRLVVMRNGQITYDGAPRNVGERVAVPS
jgi:putative ABC transport system ATP-binding protein